MLIDFTEFELETIANAMEDYINYDDEKLDTEFLFGGLSVADRVTSINNKLTHEQLDELITISKGTYDAICSNAYKLFQDRCQ